MATTLFVRAGHVVSPEIDLSCHPPGGFQLDEAAITRYIATTFASAKRRSRNCFPMIQSTNTPRSTD